MKSTSFLKFLSGSFSSRCLIFKVQSRCPFSRQLTEYITSLSPCQPFFLTFFKVFSGAGKPVIYSIFSILLSRLLAPAFSPLAKCALFYHYPSLFVKSFSSLFFSLFPFLYACPGVFEAYSLFIYYIWYTIWFCSSFYNMYTGFFVLFVFFESQILFLYYI